MIINKVKYDITVNVLNGMGEPALFTTTAFSDVALIEYIKYLQSKQDTLLNFTVTVRKNNGHQENQAAVAG